MRVAAHRAVFHVAQMPPVHLDTRVHISPTHVLGPNMAPCGAPNHAPVNLPVLGVILGATPVLAVPVGGPVAIMAVVAVMANAVQNHHHAHVRLKPRPVIHYAHR